MSVQRFRTYVMSHWQPILAYGGLFLVLALALGWQLGTLLPGFSDTEVATYHASLNLKALLDNPLNAPFLLVTKALSYIFSDTLTVVRATSALFGFGVLVLFTALLRQWHDRRTAIVGTLLFGLSAWFLHVSRLGTPEVLLFGVFALAVCGYWLKRTESRLSLIVCMLLAAALLYTPGIVWFIALGVVWQWKVLDRIFKKHLLAVTLAGVGALAALAPLGWALYKHHHLVSPWLALPPSWPSPLDILRNLAEIPFHLFIRNESSPASWLGTAPILDVFSLAMFVLGGYLYVRHVRLTRTSLFMAVLLLMCGLMALGGGISFSVWIPFLYLIVAAGTAYLLDQWFKVFPRNPIARTIGYILMYTVIALAISYHLTHYFVGWPDAQATHEVFQQHSTPAVLGR